MKVKKKHIGKNLKRKFIEAALKPHPLLKIMERTLPMQGAGSEPRPTFVILFDGVALFIIDRQIYEAPDGAFVRVWHVDGMAIAESAARKGATEEQLEAILTNGTVSSSKELSSVLCWCSIGDYQRECIRRTVDGEATKEEENLWRRYIATLDSSAQRANNKEKS